MYFSNYCWESPDWTKLKHIFLFEQLQWLACKRRLFNVGKMHLSSNWKPRYSSNTIGFWQTSSTDRTMLVYGLQFENHCNLKNFSLCLSDVGIPQGQIFLGMVSLQHQNRLPVFRLVEALDTACIRFVHFTPEDEVRARVSCDCFFLSSTTHVAQMRLCKAAGSSEFHLKYLDTWRRFLPRRWASRWVGTVTYLCRRITRNATTRGSRWRRAMTPQGWTSKVKGVLFVVDCFKSVGTCGKYNLALD